MLLCSLPGSNRGVNAAARSAMADTTSLPPPRLALASETQEVFDLLWSCRKEIPLKDSFNRSQNVDWVRDHCAHGRFWVIDLEDEIAGVMLVTPSKLGVIKKNAAAEELFYLAVRPRFRRRGVAATLLAHAQRLWVALDAKAQEDNVSRRLLEREGFVGRGPIPGGWILYEWRRG